MLSSAKPHHFRPTRHRTAATHNLAGLLSGNGALRPFTWSLRILVKQSTNGSWFTIEGADLLAGTPQNELSTLLHLRCLRHWRRLPFEPGLRRKRRRLQLRQKTDSCMVAPDRANRRM